MKAMAELTAQCSLVVCVGPGGVGKTTIAAALALEQAVAGRRVLVLTIDPARRLADALGLDGMGDQITPVSTESLGADVEVRGSLHAAMFDNATAMDSLMARVAPDAETRDGILRNRVYRAMAGSLARSHAYLAMERLHEVMHAGRWDLVILDTPPTRNALDILDAPSRLASFLEEGVVQWFVPQERKGIRGRILSGGGVAATKLLSVVLGKDFLEETLAFFKVFYRLREGFRERAGEIQNMFGRPDTAFVLVSSVDPTHLDDTRALARGLTDRGVAPQGVVFNRAYERLVEDPSAVVVSPPDAGLADLAEGLALDPESSTAFGDDDCEALITAVEALMADAAAENAAGRERAATLDGLLPDTCIRGFVPRADADIRDLHGLWALGHHLRTAAHVV
jgi:anion-transporting  ArsA/GET3 family ATPase